MADKTILDVCCGSRMFWFDRDDERVIFCDKRAERHMLKDKTVPGGQRELIISPNIQADFTALPFPSNYFQMVVFDPPHFDTSGPKSWIRAKYGALDGNWRTMLASGFDECFRVLVPNGVLIFKWSSVQIPLSEILKLTTERPLFGHRSGKASLTHWLAFTKPNTASSGRVGIHLAGKFTQPTRPPLMPTVRRRRSCPQTAGAIARRRTGRAMITLFRRLLMGERICQ